MRVFISSIISAPNRCWQFATFDLTFRHCCREVRFFRGREFFARLFFFKDTADFAMLRILTILCLTLAAGLPLSAQEHAKAPADGILDDTRAFSPGTREELAREMEKFRKEFGADVWLVAITFLPLGENLRGTSLDLRRDWSGKGDAILLLYNRSTDQEFLTISPRIWEQLPTSEIFNLRESLRHITSDKTKTPEDRLREGMLAVMSGLTTIRARETKVPQVFTRDYFRLAKAFAMTLIAGAVVFGLLSVFVRRHNVHAARQCLLPQIEVVPRLGAPFSGGTAVGWQDHSTEPA